VFSQAALAVKAMPVSIDPMKVTNLNEDGVFRYLQEQGYPVTRRMIKYAFLRREMVPVRLGVGNYVSRQNALDWVESRRQPGNYHAPEYQGSH
jgi:hypothetical protein